VEKIEERRQLSWKLSRMAKRSRNTMVGRVWEVAQLETESVGRKVEENAVLSRVLELVDCEVRENAVRACDSQRVSRKARISTRMGTGR
jgi:uncharacterized tellurite resistance protein B-like protein